MADMMADGAAWLVGQLQTNVSQTVTLWRGGKSTAGVKATKCPVRTESEPIVNEDIANFDWIIAASEYVIAADVTKPQKNDVIEESDGQKHDVLPLNNEPQARPFDPYGNGWRVHTKRIKEAD